MIGEMITDDDHFTALRELDDLVSWCSFGVVVIFGRANSSRYI